MIKRAQRNNTGGDKDTYEKILTSLIELFFFLLILASITKTISRMLLKFIYLVYFKITYYQYVLSMQ